MPSLSLTPEHILPADAAQALLVGRLWVPALGPVVVGLRGDALVDLTPLAPTMSDLLELDDVAARVRGHLETGTVVGALGLALAGDGADATLPTLLAPCDLQVIKASGVTFVDSLLERVIEEQARGDASKAHAIRQDLVSVLGDNLAGVVPGSAQAMQVKQVLIQRGVWSQYLEVGIGPDAEVFTKAPVLAAVGVGAEVGIHPKSAWNNPEPEVVLAVTPQGVVVGAALGNDVNLRDFEGRSALLLSKAKDNNASCAIGPFIRLFDDGFGLDDVRACEIALTVQGADGFLMQGSSSMRRISRDPLDIVAQVLNPQHAYPDGFMLFLGTMFAPTQDRHGPGQGFTHVVGDVVTIATPRLGALVNRVVHADQAPRWRFGLRALMGHLARRGLLANDA